MRRLGSALLLLFCVVSTAAAGAELPKHLLLVSVDTLRAGALGSYGAKDDPTPRIDDIAARGVLFEDVLTVIGKTGPSFASLFSSLYPPTHGSRRNGVPMRDDVPLLAELLRDEGFETAAFITNWTLKSHLAGVDRGFAHYDEELPFERNGLGADEREAADVTAAALGWLAKRESTERLFLWVHYSDPHTPYQLKAGYGPPKPSREQRRSGWEKRWHYASEVSYADSVDRPTARGRRRRHAQLRDPARLRRRPRREPRRARILGPRQEHPLGPTSVFPGS